MGPKDRLRRQLTAARETSECFLRDFDRPEDWTRQVYEGANHALWFAGHMGTTDDFFISLIVPERTAPRDEYAARFGVGSQPTSDPADYPAVDEVLAYMRERRAVLLQILSELDEQELARPTPNGAPDFIPDIGSVFETAIWHEGLHSGQLSVVRRAMGHPPRR